jgi:hypothetical protein
MKNKTVLVILFLILFSLLTVYLSVVSSANEGAKIIKSINSEKNTDRTVNEYAFPIVEDDMKYIEYQTKEWIEKRERKKPCYAVLEKDKIVMTKWMEMYDINIPEIYDYCYHDEFSIGKLKSVLEKNRDKYLIIKITHLQSSYGIILVPPNPTEKEIQDIYQKCQNKFLTSFVCNHDKNDPPSREEIKNGKKSSYYKLYETIKPGIIIQDYFESYNSGYKGKNTPIEIKIIMFGGNILSVNKNYYSSLRSYYLENKRYRLLFEEARRISNLLGSTMIRVDFFVKQKDNPYIPYLNEISLSPNGGMRNAWFYSKDELEDIREEVKHLPRGDYRNLNKLIENCPYRDLPIKEYMTDGEGWWSYRNEKY